MVFKRASLFSLACALLLAAALAGCENVSSRNTEAPAAAGSLEKCQPAPLAAPAELRSRAGYTEITATVTDANGAYVHGLGKDDFYVTVDGAPRIVEFFQTESNPPASVGILVDTSGSMQPKIPQARAAIMEFIGDLNKRDDVFLFAFSSRPFLLAPFTTDHDLVLQRLDTLHAYGQTALFDTIIQGITMVQKGCFEKKVLLVLTDGMDNSSVATVNEVVAEAKRSGVLVYSVGIGDPNAPATPAIILGPNIIGGGDIERVDAQTLRSLAAETGSRAFIIRRVGDGDALRSAYRSIGDDLRAQYTLGFVAVSAAASASTGKLSVQLRDRPGLTVRTRESVPPPAPGAATASQ